MKGLFDVAFWLAGAILAALPILLLTIFLTPFGLVAFLLVGTAALARSRPRATAGAPV